MSVDLDRLLAHLDPDGRGGRRHVDEVATAICALAPHIDAAAVPELVRDTIQAGERQGMWSSTRTVTVHRGRTTLPKSIILPRSGAPADQLRPVAVPLRDELASWAATLPLSQTQRQVLLAVNDWLRRTDGGNTAVAEAAERAYELLGDEKAFDSTPPRGGATLWGSGRLTFQLLRCHPHPDTPHLGTDNVNREPARTRPVRRKPRHLPYLPARATHPQPPTLGRRRLGPRPQHRTPGIPGRPAVHRHQPRLPRRSRPSGTGHRGNRLRHGTTRRNTSRPSRTTLGTSHPAARPSGPADQRHRRPPTRLLAPRDDPRTGANSLDDRPRNPAGSATRRPPHNRAGLTGFSLTVHGPTRRSADIGAGQVGYRGSGVL